jgi:hypothetical protein
MIPAAAACTLLLLHACILFPRKCAAATACDVLLHACMFVLELFCVLQQVADICCHVWLRLVLPQSWTISFVTVSPMTTAREL